jgi:hypothetical protein
MVFIYSHVLQIITTVALRFGNRVWLFGIRILWILILLMWRIWWAPNNASKWQIGFKSAVKGLKHIQFVPISKATFILRGGADKSLARPTSRCRRTESIVSLERVFSCYRGWNEACQVTRPISITSGRGLSLSFFPAKQGAEGNLCHTDRNIRGICTIVCHCQKLGGPI